MAKALFGHVGPDLRTPVELAGLRRRVADLEAQVGGLTAEVARLREANAALVDALATDHGVLTITVPDTAEAALA